MTVIQFPLRKTTRADRPLLRSAAEAHMAVAADRLGTVHHKLKDGVASVFVMTAHGSWAGSEQEWQDSAPD